jgi:tRNA/tmRNA/rRNA uracil-C5-methylase (TrmA/RlmC/RlmD family)
MTRQYSRFGARRPAFRSLLERAAREHGIIDLSGVEPLAAIPYGAEFAMKKDVVQEFLEPILGETATKLVRAPQGRHYRSTSRWQVNRRFRASELDPKWHTELYRTLATAAKDLDMLRSATKFVVVRGTETQKVVLMTVAGLDSDIVRQARRLGERLQEKDPAVTSFWLYVDPTDGSYYLERERPIQGVAEKKIFGHRAWLDEINGVRYQVGVFSFSQINRPMVPLFVERIVGAAALERSDTLLDLYCGYGLFGAATATQVSRVVAVDFDDWTVNNARYNITRAGGKVFARTMPITESSLERLAAPRTPEVVILDPPRSGTDEGVIPAIAARKPRRIVHVFCGPDEIERSIKEWKKEGYAVVQAVPMDFFPGTLGLEVIVTLEGATHASPAPTRTR